VPVQTAQIALLEFEFAQRQRRPQQAEAALTRAVQADPWSAAAAIWQADWLHWKMVGRDESAQLRQAWQRAAELAKTRAGHSPSAWEQIGRQQLHLYQRFGNRQDLAAAEETFRHVVAWNPADQQGVAQLAAIAQSISRDLPVGGDLPVNADRAADSNRAAAGGKTRAKKLAQRAWYLSRLGNNMERSLERQLIYVPQPLGRSAAEKPALAPASELLSNQLR
jgi:hypothetical protein